MKEAEITNEIVKPSFNEEVIVNIPKDMPVITHNLDKLEEFAKSLKTFYSKLVFSDDSIDAATNERKKVNSLIETVKRLRIDKVKEYKKPIEDFEKTAKNIESLLGEAKDSIQVFIDKAEDERRTNKKIHVILPLINECVGKAFIDNNVLISPDDIIEDKRWYNKTYKEADIEKDIMNQVNELVRQQNEFNQGIEVIKSTLEAYNNMNAYDKYVERFKYTKDLTSILSDIKEESKVVSGTVNNVTLAAELNDLSMFDNVKEEQTVNNVSTDAIIIKTFRGTEQQMYDLCQYALQLGMEVVENGFY